MRRDLWIRMMFFAWTMPASALPACTCGSEKAEKAAPAFVPVDRAAKGGAAQNDTETQYDPNVKPVYPANTKPHPLAERLCRALQTLPVERRRACCKTDTGVMLTSECVRNLSGALALDAVRVEESEIAACETAIAREYEGCEWVGGLNQPTPAECLGLIHGKLERGAECRSSLECPEPLRCLGSGPTDPGKCGDALPQGRLCNTAVDPLAAYTRQDDLEDRHPACQGFCDRNRCYDATATGAACKVNVECGRGHRCKEGKCIAEAFAKEGEVCLGGECASGLRCSGKKCIVPRPAGESCANDFDCRAACVSGKCGMSCTGLPMILRPQATSTAAH